MWKRRKVEKENAEKCERETLRKVESEKSAVRVIQRLVDFFRQVRFSLFWRTTFLDVQLIYADPPFALSIFFSLFSKSFIPMIKQISWLVDCHLFWMNQFSLLGLEALLECTEELLESNVGSIITVITWHIWWLRQKGNSLISHGTSSNIIWKWMTGGEMVINELKLGGGGITKVPFGRKVCRRRGEKSDSIRASWELTRYRRRIKFKCKYKSD